MAWMTSLEKGWDVPVWWVQALCAAALFLAFGLSLMGKSGRGYVCAFLAIASCGCIAAYFCRDGGTDALALSACLAGLLFGVSYPCLWGLLALQARYQSARERRRELLKKDKFVLPDKDNDFLRDRLKNSLCVRTPREIPVEDAFELAYVRRTLAKLKNKNLSPADRVELERISAELTKLCFEKSISEEELRRINERFARVLKLAAKYAV